MRTIDTPKGLAARLGGWSARHKKSVLAGWFVFVALAMLVSMFVPANKLTKADQFTGESGRAEKTLESSFPKPASEMVLIHSGSLTTDDAAFARGISQTAAGFAALPVVDHLRAPGRGDGTGLVSKDRHSALITFTIKGDADTASTRIAPVVAAVKDAQQVQPRAAHRGVRRRHVGRPARQEGAERSAQGRDDVASDHAADPGDRVRRDRGGGRAGAAGDLGRAGHASAWSRSRARSSRSTTTPRS